MDFKTKRRFFYEVLIIVILFILLVVTTIGDWLLVVDNERQTLNNEVLYTNLLEEEVSLESQVNKLLDEEYLARHAREMFFYSKEGELIIRIPEGE